MKRIALVGTAPSQTSVPIDDLSIEIWGVSQRSAKITRADRWFELHRLDGEDRDWAKLWRDEMKKWPQDCDIYMLYPEPDLSPRIKQFDPGPLIAKYGTFFMTSSFSWMMAMAIEEILSQNNQGAIEGEIFLYGVDMEYGTEYAQQRVGLRHFIDVAKLFGIKVTRVVSSGIAYEPIPYPLWQDDPLLSKLELRSNAIKNDLKSMNDSKITLQTMYDKGCGRLQALTDVKIAYAKQDDKWDLEEQIKMMTKECDRLENALHENAKKIAELEGTKAEQDWFRDYLQP